MLLDSALMTQFSKMTWKIPFRLDCLELDYQDYSDLICSNFYHSSEWLLNLYVSVNIKTYLKNVEDFWGLRCDMNPLFCKMFSSLIFIKSLYD